MSCNSSSKMGLSVHGDVMIVSETTRLAMPETAIGFFPDVGGTYFLNQLSYDAGKWLGICGEPVTGFEAVTVGLATHCVPSLQWSTLTDAIEQQGRTALNSVLPTITRSADDTEFKKLLEKRCDWFSVATHEELVATLKSSAESRADTPQNLDLAACLQLELKAGEQAVRHPDFVEGIRAVLVDKEPAQWTS